MDKATYKSRYNNPSTGYFKDQTAQARIPSQERDLVEKTADNSLFFDDNFSDDEDTSAQSVIKTISERVADKLNELKQAVTSGGTIALDLEFGKIKSFYPSHDVAANKAVVPSNYDNAIKVILFLNITGAYTLTFPVGSYHQDFAGGWAANVWTCADPGRYRIEMYWDGTVWQIDIYGKYSNT
jgi:hypothetical protein